MRIGSLFSGIGGLELGLEQAGVGHTVWQVEIDPFCRAVLAHHWPDATRHEDVRTVGAHNLAPCDVIAGGFPCQDISYAGKGAGLAGARSGLWYEYARIIRELGPRYVVVENVRALLTRGLDAVLGTLADLGYDAQWGVLRASDVGAPHRRERVFLIAWRREDVADTDDADREWRAAWRQPARSGDAALRGEVVGDARSAGREERLAPALAGHARHAAGERGGLGGWGDAVPVRGCDGTVRYIPRDAAAAGIESAFRLVVDGLPDGVAGRTVHTDPEAQARYVKSVGWPVAVGTVHRVARFRATGNAVVPACARVIGHHLLALDAMLRSTTTVTDTPTREAA